MSEQTPNARSSQKLPEQVDWQRATSEALGHLFCQVRTEPLTLQSLSDIYGVSRRMAKDYLAELEGVERIGTLYRVPIRHLPLEHVREKVERIRNNSEPFGTTAQEPDLFAHSSRPAS